ncbi:MAG: 50S ribosomal protein L3 N(5)-glutamine methyltransferase [Reinekea sp.]|nr:50S ribosomal protein L3 N(5)-glutamine methyltransferase [Reinekea sp.]
MAPVSLQAFPSLQELQPLTTITDWIRYAASQMERHECFYGHGFADPISEAQYLVLRTLQLDWDTPEIFYSSTLLPDEKALVLANIEQRCVAKVPTAYLLQEAWFCNEPFRVTPDVLIPRSPIAELIETRFEPWLVQQPRQLLDLCTGSGCIGIAMARAFPECHVDISDLSQTAVDIAIDNVSAKDLGYQVDVYQGDLFQALPDTRYDLIVSNPPYVDAEDIDDMPAEFAHEPRLGLAAGDDGLDIVRRILLDAPNYLTEDGWLVCEVGNSAVTLMETFADVPFQWPEFTAGGHGVFVISAQDLKAHQHVFLQ